MNVVTLEEIKANSRIEGKEEDQLLVDMGEAAEELVANSIRRNWWEVEADFGTIPASLKRAVLMLVDHMYLNRGASGVQMLSRVPYGVEELVKPYRILK